MRKSLIIFAISLFFFISEVSALTRAPVDVTTMSIEELLDAMDKGYLTSETLVNIYLERIEAYDDKFNSINQLNEHAIEQAKELDEERENGELRGRLHGIPILVKCNIDVYGMPTTGGTKALKNNYPKENSFVVQKLIDEGAIILGSTNMSEMAFSARDSYSSYGYVRNVFNTEYTSYGSSGGSAVAVSASFAAASLGTDTNSSVRLPAAGAGLVGMRPTLGLVSRSGVIPYDVERDTVGVLSRNVSDNALLLNIISGTDKNDSITKSAIIPKAEIGNSSLEGITIGVPTQYTKGSSSGSGVTKLTDSDIYALVEKSIEEMEAAGAKIVYLDKFVKNSNLTLAKSTQSGITMCDGFNKYIKGSTGNIKSFEQFANASGHVYGVGGYVGGCNGNYFDKNKIDSQKKVYRDYIDGYFKEYDLDVIIYPTLKNKVYKNSDKSGKNVSPGSSIGSVVGYPSVTVPMGYVGEFSYGIEFLGRAYSEETLYRVAAGYEEVNKNELINPILVPSLYDVPTSVTKLLVLYEDVLSKNSDLGKVREWLDEVELFISSYNTLEDVDAEATRLMDMYDELFIKYISNKNYSTVADFLAYFTILLMILSGLIIFKEIKMCFK